MHINRLTALLLSGFSVLLSSVTQAQITEPNAEGVSMGHLHYEVASPETERTFWLNLGAQDLGLEGRIGVSFPGLIILLSEGETAGGSEGSVVNHVAFRVESLKEIEDKGFELEYNQEFPGIASIYSPSGERIELFDDNLATNIGFELEAGYSDPVAERHNQDLTASIVTHHLHFYVPAGQAALARDWYVQNFAAVPGQRWRYLAADLPGMNLNFSEVDGSQQATEGRTLDHIGFEVRNLEAFCQALEENGIGFDVEYRKLESGIGIAFLTDPWGAKIELTEGLSDI